MLRYEWLFILTISLAAGSELRGPMTAAQADRLECEALLAPLAPSVLKKASPGLARALMQSEPGQTYRIRLELRPWGWFMLERVLGRFPRALENQEIQQWKFAPSEHRMTLSVRDDEFPLVLALLDSVWVKSASLSYKDEARVMSKTLEKSAAINSRGLLWLRRAEQMREVAYKISPTLWRELTENRHVENLCRVLVHRRDGSQVVLETSYVEILRQAAAPEITYLDLLRAPRGPYR